MPRPVDPQIREDLLEAILEAVEHLGLADFSLRPLAEAIGSSPRTILYHFGSKEQLVAEVIASGRARLGTLFFEWARASDGYDLRDALRRVWSYLTASRRRAFIKLFFEFTSVGMRDPRGHGRPVGGLFAEWRERFESEFTRRGLSRERATLLASLVLATIHGLLLDLITTGDRARVDRAFASFIAAIELPVTKTR